MRQDNRQSPFPEKHRSHGQSFVLQLQHMNSLYQTGKEHSTAHTSEECSVSSSARHKGESELPERSCLRKSVRQIREGHKKSPRGEKGRANGSWC